MKINDILKGKVEEILSTNTGETYGNTLTGETSRNTLTGERYNILNTLLISLTDDKEWMKANNIQSIELITIPYQKFVADIDKGTVKDDSNKKVALSKNQHIFLNKITSGYKKGQYKVLKKSTDIVLDDNKLPKITSISNNIDKDNIKDYIKNNIKHAYLVANTDQGQIIIDPNTQHYRQDKNIFIGNMKELIEDLTDLLIKNNKHIKYYNLSYNSSTLYIAHEPSLQESISFITSFITWYCVGISNKKYATPTLEDMFYNKIYEDKISLPESVQLLFEIWYGGNYEAISAREIKATEDFIGTTQKSDNSCKTNDICNKINDYHTAQGFMYPLLDRCIDKYGNLHQQDPEAMEIIHTLWTLIYHDIQNNTLNASKTKDTEGRGIYTNSYSHIVLYQKLVDYIKHRDLDKNANKITSNFVSDISNKYGTNAPELEINEMNYRKFCKTLLEECAKEIIESKPPISQILCSYLNDIGALNTLVISYVSEAAKSIYMPKELKKFYTHHALHDIINLRKNLRKKVEEILSINNGGTDDILNTLLIDLTDDKKFMNDNNIQSIKLITIPYQDSIIKTENMYISTNVNGVRHVKNIELDSDYFKHQYLVANTNQGEIIIDPNTQKYRNDKAIFIGSIQELTKDLKNLLAVNYKYYQGNSSVFEKELEQYHCYIAEYISKRAKDNCENNKDNSENNLLSKCTEKLIAAWYGNHISKLIYQGKSNEMKEEVVEKEVKQKDPNSIISSPSSTSSFLDVDEPPHKRLRKS